MYLFLLSCVVGGLNQEGVWGGGINSHYFKIQNKWAYLGNKWGGRIIFVCQGKNPNCEMCLRWPPKGKCCPWSFFRVSPEKYFNSSFFSPCYLQLPENAPAIQQPPFARNSPNEQLPACPSTTSSMSRISLRNSVKSGRSQIHSSSPRNGQRLPCKSVPLRLESVRSFCEHRTWFRIWLRRLRIWNSPGNEWICMNSINHRIWLTLKHHCWPNSIVNWPSKSGRWWRS